jgi:hypothetical protein
MSEERTTRIKAEDLVVHDTEKGRHVIINGMHIRLAQPFDLGIDWVGEGKSLNQMFACWYAPTEDDHPMSPRLVGKPGVGKTVMAYAVGKKLDRPVYFFQATSDTTPNDVLVTPIVVETGKDSSTVQYVASALVTAMIVGGVVVFDEGNRMQEKAWAALAPLLDSRRYVDCTNIGLFIQAHREFRYVATMNDDASCFELPEYIKSRLQPTITIENPTRAEERGILEVNLPTADPVVLDYVADFLDLARKSDEDYSIRDGIHIANYACKLMKYEEYCGRDMDPGEAVIDSVEQILGVRQARYIKQILWAERAA